MSLPGIPGAWTLVLHCLSTLGPKMAGKTDTPDPCWVGLHREVKEGSVLNFLALTDPQGPHLVTGYCREGHTHPQGSE